MRLAWGGTKRHSNLRKHGLDFTVAPRVLARVLARVLEDPALTVENDRFSGGEQRFIALGLRHDGVVVMALND